MTETGLPTYLTRQFALTRPQLATELGAELLSLCQTVTADGRLAPEEIAGLWQWLGDADAAEMQAARFLRGVIERVLADGKITAEEYQEVYRAVEAVLPFEARQQAHAAREIAESSALSTPAQVSTAQPAAGGWAQAEPTPIVDVTFMVAGVRQGGRPALIEQHASAGLAVTLELTVAGSRGDEAIAVKLPGGAQIGFVPAAESRQFVPLLRQGSRCSAHIVRIRSSGRSPIPVVQARFLSAAIEASDPLALASSQPLAAAARRRRVLVVLAGIAAALFVLAMGVALGAVQSDTTPNLTVAAAESAFLDYLDDVGAVGHIESGGAKSFGGKDLAAWKARLDTQRQQLDEALFRLEPGKLGTADQDAVASMRKSVTELDTDDTTAGIHARTCADAQRHDLDYSSLRAALVSCYVEHGNRLQYDGGTIDRGTALQLLHVVDDRASRKAIFDAFVPLWTALNGRDEADSPYRRMIAMAAADARKNGSQIDAAARAIGVETTDVEHWLVQVLTAWRDANPADPIEPWDFRYVNGAANRELQARIPAAALLPANQRFYRDLGADLTQLGVVFDLESRPDKSPLAYTDFLVRGRTVKGEWHRPIARVLGTYPAGGLFSLNELVHENGHAVHVSAIRTRPAYMDWPDTLFTEAFADVPSWSVHEPAWQRRYLGAAVAESASMRALFANVMLDVAWSLFELRLLRDPALDPNAVWTDITHEYLRVVPHPEVPWWAMRVQLAGNPGYMVNYGLGALLTAEMRAHTAAVIGPFDTGNPRWYAWLSGQLLQHGSERDTQRLLQDLLGRRLSPDALLEQIKRCGAHNP